MHPPYPTPMSVHGTRHQGALGGWGFAHRDTDMALGVQERSEDPSLLKTEGTYCGWGYM